MSTAPQTQVHTTLDRSAAVRCGMGLAVIAREHPQRLAVATPVGDRSFDFLNARANQLARALRRRGLRAGDGVAVVCSNRPELVVALAACVRSGLRLTPINWHLTAGEISYILQDCQARALLAEDRFRPAIEAALRKHADPAVRIAIAGPIHGFEIYEEVLDAELPHDLEDPLLGHTMLYTSGTTGRPKGVYRKPEASLRGVVVRKFAEKAGYQAGHDLHLCTGPLYHAAPLAISLSAPLSAGCGVVIMDQFDPLRALELVAAYRITHSHMVPIMFHRLLALPEDDRMRFDTSSLKAVIHGAAPCPVEIKRRMMEWLGPVIWEYYSATEGFGSLVSPEEWLLHQGTVGRPDPGTVEVRDADGKACAVGEPGRIFLRRRDDGGFVYFGDPEKTERTWQGDWFTLGDVGYADADGYLYLCDRSADVIVSGGVNVYPAEVDAVLLTHPAVRDAAAVGAPDDEWGEQVVAVVELHPDVAPSDAMTRELHAHCRRHLAGFKCPRRIEYTLELPRSEAGKVRRAELRERFWQGRQRKI